MSNFNVIKNIVKKELRRFFTDKRMVLSLILPGILIFIIYTFMGNIFTNSFTDDLQSEHNVTVINAPTWFENIYKQDEINFVVEVVAVKNEDLPNKLLEYKKQVEEKNLHLLIVFEENLEEKIQLGLKPKTEIYYNSVDTKSQTTYQYFYNVLYNMSVEVNYYFLVNNDLNVNYDLSSQEDLSIKIITMMVPYLLLIFLFSGCMGITPEAISGEKERGTIATLLVTPVPRSSIAIGKVIALSITSLFSAVVSFVGLLGSLPKLLGAQGDITLSMYTFSTYLMLFVIIVVTVLLFIVLLSVLSTFAKGVKEAGQYATPVMMLVTLIGITSMFGDSANQAFYIYLIPIYNLVTGIQGILALSITGVEFALVVGSNICYIALGIYLLTKMFNSEKIMFNR